ncbi:hypothetical protein RB195_020267 [Necator americanus]|uniref:Uncharacterized protein n=1 Tax=Necator americanus TaxID=51031 RepID=A0ABR1CKS5_NECAM
MSLGGGYHNEIDHIIVNEKEKVVIKARDIGQFMNRCLQQYFSEYQSGKKLQPSSLAKLKPEELPFYKDENFFSETETAIDIHDREVDITTLLLAPDCGFMDSSETDDQEKSSSCHEGASTSEAGNGLPRQRSPNHCADILGEDQKVTGLRIAPSENQSSNDVPELNETDPSFMQQIFMVQGQALMELFRFCPQCGCALQEKGGVQLKADGSTPIVHYICNCCSLQTTSVKLWKGQRKAETKSEDQ